MSAPRDPLVDLVAELDEDGALARVHARLAAGDVPSRIIEDCQAGLAIVGERYEDGAFFISGLVMAGEILRETMVLVEPLMRAGEPAPPIGTVLLCTVQGDIHDLGKNLLGMLLRSRRFTVHDLGVDVAPDEVARAVADLRPDVVGLSGLLTTSFPNMRTTASAVREMAAGLGIRLPVIVGGGQMTAETAAWVGADGWSINAATGVQAIADLVAEARRSG